ncbi:MAG: SAM-dependent methyltransferase, partial [Jatrophihabitans sp.]
MSHTHHAHAAPAVVRHCDVVVLGESAAGLAAALELGRARRSVIVVGGGGAATPDVAALRDDVHRHGGEILAMGVADVASGDGTVRVELPEGNAV